MDTANFQALSDPNRLAIIELLADGERCVCEVSRTLDMSNALASHHIKKLRDAGLVSTRRKGSWLHCSLDHEAVASLSTSLAGLAARAAEASGTCCACGESGGAA